MDFPANDQSVLNAVFSDRDDLKMISRKWQTFISVSLSFECFDVEILQSVGPEAVSRPTAGTCGFAGIPDFAVGVPPDRTYTVFAFVGVPGHVLCP